MRPSILVFVIVLALGAVGGGRLAAEDLPSDPVSQAQMDRYQPLMEAFQSTFEAGDYPKALTQILSIRTQVEKEFDPTHSAVLQINVGVATVYTKLKKAKEAEAVLADLRSRLAKKKLTGTQKALFVWITTRDLEKELGREAQSRDADSQVQVLVKLHPEWAPGDKGGSDPEKEAQKSREVLQKGIDEVYQGAGSDPEWAVARARDLVAQTEELAGTASPAALQARRVLAWALDNAGHGAEADELYGQVQSQWEAPGQKPTFDLLLVLDERAQWAQRSGQNPARFQKRLQELTTQNKDLAAQWKQELAKRAQKEKDQPPKDSSPKDKGPDWAAQIQKADEIWAQGNQTEAVEVLRKAYDQARTQRPPTDPLLQQMRQKLDAFEKALPPPDPTGGLGPRIQQGVDLLAQADTEAASGDPTVRNQALAHYRQAVTLLDFDPQPRRDEALALTRWARLVQDLNHDADRAEVLLLKASDLLSRIAKGKDKDGASVNDQLAALYQSLGRGPEAQAAKAQADKLRP